MITRPKVSSIVASQLPEFIRDEYQTFVDFLKAYYDFLETTQKDPTTLRDIDTTLDAFIKYFKDELAAKIPYSTVDDRFLISRIKDLYLAKGSEASYKLLFRILFNKDITVNYPSTQMLRASDGKWNQDVSVFVKILIGSPQDIVGKLVDVVTQSKVVRVLVDRRQYVEVEVDRAIRISDDTYEFIIDRRFFGTISVGDTLRYLDNNNNLVFNGLVLPTTSSLLVEAPGTGFKVGDLYTINNFQGYGSIMKVSRVNSTGGITQAQFIKYGTGYTTDFSSSIISQKGQDTASAVGVSITRVDSFLAPANKSIALGISESTYGFAESGSINTADYNLAASSVLTGTLTATNGSATITGVGTLFTTQLAFGDLITLSGIQHRVLSITSNTNLTLTTTFAGTTSTLTSVAVSKPAAFDGSYTGLIIREFGIASTNSVDTTTTPAIIKVTLGPLAKYPGYYVNNDGFLDDAIYIQDSNYYQAFSYVIKIDQSLNTYKTIVKNLIHPAGMAVFGEYDLRNEFSIQTAVDSIIKILSVSINDSVVSAESKIWAFSKLINSATLLNNLSADNNNVITLDTDGSGSARTMPFITSSKLVDSSTTNYNSVVESQSVATSGDTQIRDIIKTLNSVAYNHYLNNGSILDTDTVTESDTISAKDFGKLLNGTTLTYSDALDSNSTIPTEITYVYNGGATRTGISSFVVDKSITDSINTPSDTNAASANDLNRTIPAISFVKTPITENYSGVLDSGGDILVNPYAEAGWFLNDAGSYVGAAISFTG